LNRLAKKSPSVSIKKCKSCLSQKPLNEFYNSKAGKGGKLSICAPCERERVAKWRDENPNKYKRARKNATLKTSFGITVEDFELMVDRQDNKCAICGLKGEESVFGTLCVDHNHHTGKIRELLCTHCNAAIGQLKESPKIMAAAIAYIEKHEEHE